MLRRLHNAAVIGLAAPLVLLPRALRAQDSRRDTLRLDPVVTTATRTPVTRSRAPVAVTVLTGDELRAQGIVRVTDALQRVPGAAIARTGAFGATTTLFLRGGERDYVKVLVDGVPVNDAGGDFDFASLTTDDVERIEVQRGPGSVVYGSDAVTGVIQIFTRRGGRDRASLDARAGSYGTREASADAAGSVGALSWSAGGATRRTDGILAFNNQYRNDALTALLRLAPTATTDVQLTSRWTGSTYHFPTDFSGAVTDSNQYTRERRLSTGLDAGWRVAPPLEARLLLSDSRSRRVSDNAPDSPGDTTDFYSRDDADRYRRGADARLNLNLPGASVATVGAAYEAEGETSHGTSAFGTAPLPPTDFHEHRVNRAGYAQLVASAADAATLTLGGRYDDNGSFGIFRTGRAALSVALPLGIRARLAAGNAFKEPAFSEQFSTAFTFGNRELRPERTRSYEGALEGSFARDAITLGATYFSQRFDDLVQYRPTAPSDAPDMPNYFNIASAKAAGVEVELRTPPVASLSASAQYSYVDTRVLEAGFGASGTFVAGDALLRRPTRTASATLTYAPPRRGSLSATLSHVGSRSDRDFVSFPARTVSLPAYTTLDLGGSLDLGLRSPAPSIALTARLENALARRYQSVYGYDSPRAVVLVGARVTSR
jgi:vitamin B12 transporter